MELLTIGAFARASRLSPKALRLYDSLGLLKPAHVDEVSGYRFYRPDQLERARLVAWLRRIGMPLARIQVVCDRAGQRGRRAGQHRLRGGRRHRAAARLSSWGPGPAATYPRAADQARSGGRMRTRATSRAPGRMASPIRSGSTSASFSLEPRISRKVPSAETSPQTMPR